MSAIATSPTLRANTIRDVDVGKYTRTVMTTVPAMLLMVLWGQINAGHGFPTTQTYLERLFKGLGQNRETVLRSELGILFFTMIDRGTAVTLGTVSTLLSDGSSTRSVIMREHCMSLYKLIATSYAFTVPQQFSAFTSQIRVCTTANHLDDG